MYSLTVSNGFALFCALLPWLTIFPLAVADDSDVRYKIKAGYLYNFTRFIEWPSDTETTFNLCIAGNDPFGMMINPIEKRTAFGKPIKLWRGHALVQRHCHILYISPFLDDSLAVTTLLQQHISHSTLTVGEGSAFTQQGGMIGFINWQDKIKLRINAKRLQQSGLTISAKLLEVAEIDGDNP